MSYARSRSTRLLFLPVLLMVAAACGDAARLTQPDADGLPPLRASSSSASGDVFAYVTNFGSDDVSVINTATNTVVATIPVGDIPQQLAITPDGAELFVANSNSDNVSVISTATNTVTATVPVGDKPWGVAVSPDGASVYVTNSNDGTVTVLDAQTLSVDATIAVGGQPLGIGVTPDGAHVYVVIVQSSSQGVVTRINTATLTLDGTIPVGLFPRLVSFSPDGAFAWVANQGKSDDVSKIDVATFTVAATIPIPTPVSGNGAFEVALTPDGAAAYVSNLLDNNVAIINTATDMVTGTISVGTHPQGLKVTPDGAFLYVAHFTSNDVYVISTATNTVVGSPIPIGTTGRGLVMTPPPLDDEGPETASTLANPNPVGVGTNVDLTANVDDTNTGGSEIASAEYNLDGGPVTGMSTADGAFDEVAEAVEASFLAPAQAGVFDLCVGGTDAVGNLGAAGCIMLVVYDPNGGFVTGGGWIDSPAGAYAPDPMLTGKANFGFVSKYKKGASVPTGNTQFQFQTGDLNFHSSSYDWLVVTGSNYARFKGSGTINGAGDYKFMLWAGDDTPDTFRIKIWSEDEAGAETVVYDNGTDQPIGGGSIKIHEG